MYFISGKYICYEITVKFVPKCPIDNKSVLGLVMAYRQQAYMSVPNRMVTVPSCHLLYV